MSAHQTPRQLMTLHWSFISDLLSPMKINSFPLSGLAGSLVCQWAVTIAVQGWTWPVNCCWQEENMLTANRTSQNTDLHFIERGSEQGHWQDVGHAWFRMKVFPLPLLHGTQMHKTSQRTTHWPDVWYRQSDSWNCLGKWCFLRTMASWH